MVNIDDHLQVLKKIFDWLNNLSSFVLSCIIIGLIVILLLVIRFYRNKQSQTEVRNQQISNDIFSIKQQSVNTSTIAIFPEKIICSDPNFKSEYNCKLLLNSFEPLGSNFAITISTTTRFIVKDHSNTIINTSFIGGYFKLHMNEHYFQSIDNYCFVSFKIFTDSETITSIQIELTNENANGNFKFILPA